VQRLYRYAIVTVTTGVLAAATGVALADSAPTVERLQQDCGTVAKDCRVLHARDRKEFLADRKQVGDVVWGCASGGGTQAISWSDTTGTTTSVSGTTSISGGLATVINAGFAATFGMSWSTSRTVSSTTSVSVHAGKVAWIVRAAPMQSFVGDLSMWYPEKVDGHYNWIIQNYTVTGPRDGAGNVVILDRDMTAQEKAEICGRNPGPGVAARDVRPAVVVTRHQMDIRSARRSTPVAPPIALPGPGLPVVPSVTTRD
jgi:hypothetical protein